MRKNIALLFLGIVLVLFGVCWGGNAVGLWDFDLFFDGWWSLFFIVLPIYGMMRHGVKWFDVCILLFGVIALLSSVGIINWMKIRLLFFPALLVFIGLSVIFSIFKRKPSEKLEREAASKINAVFGANRKRLDGQVYEGGCVDAEFGGVELDLRNAVIEQDIAMNVSAVFGGVKIWFPPNVRVIVDNSSVLGGVKNNVRENNAYNVPTVRLRCCAIFGGIELY